MSGPPRDWIHTTVYQAVLRAGFVYKSLAPLECTCTALREGLRQSGTLREVLRSALPRWNFDAVPSAALHKFYCAFKASCLELISVGRPAASFHQLEVWDSDEDSDGSDACRYHYVRLSLEERTRTLEDAQALDRLGSALDGFRWARRLQPALRSELLDCHVQWSTEGVARARWDDEEPGLLGLAGLLPASSSCVYFAKDTSVRFSFQLCVVFRHDGQSLVREVCLKVKRLPVDAQTHRRNYKFDERPEGWMSNLVKDLPFGSPTHIAALHLTLQFLQPFVPKVIDVGRMGCFSQGSTAGGRRRHECVMAQLFSGDRPADHKGVEAVLHAIRTQQEARFILCVQQECGRIGDR